MRFFPIFVDLKHQPVLVVGGGEQAAQKLRLIVRTAARVRVLATDPCAEIVALAAAGAIALERRGLRPDDLAGVRLAYVALEDEAAAEAAVAMARAAGVPVNAIDRQHLCDFLTPAILDRDPLVIAIGTEGAAPVLARQLKTRLETMLPPTLGGLVRWAASLRGRVAAAVGDPAARRRFWDGFFTGPAAQAFLAGRHREAEALAAADLTRARAPVPGRISLVGAGPGDPDLLTVKAVRALQEADVILADRALPPAVLERARRDARRILVDGRRDRPEIDATLTREARAGRHTVRLVGGDLALSGRDRAWLATLRSAGIPVELVPGIPVPSNLAAATAAPTGSRGGLELAA